MAENPLTIQLTGGQWGIREYNPYIVPIWKFPKIRGTFLGGLYNKDYSILGSLFGSPYFGKLPYNIFPYSLLTPSKSRSKVWVLHLGSRAL